MIGCRAHRIVQSGSNIHLNACSDPVPSPRNHDSLRRYHSLLSPRIKVTATSSPRAGQTEVSPAPSAPT